MSEETRGLITWMLGTTASILVLVGILVRYVLLPYLREHLIAPVKQVEKQVSENHHSNKEPTVLDRIDDVQTELRALVKQVTSLAAVVEAHADVQTEHSKWSGEWTQRIEKDVTELKGRVGGGSTT